MNLEILVWVQAAVMITTVAVNWFLGRDLHRMLSAAHGREAQYRKMLRRQRLIVKSYQELYDKASERAKTWERMYNLRTYGHHGPYGGALTIIDTDGKPS